MSTSWPTSLELGGDVGADVAAAGDDDSHQCAPLSGTPVEVLVELVDAVAGHRDEDHVALLGDQRGGRARWPRPAGSAPTTRATPSTSRSSSGWPAQWAGTTRSTRQTLALGSIHSTPWLVVGEDAAQHPLGGPLHGGDGGDAEALVDGGPAGVVDAGHDPVDLEGLAGDAGHHDVGVVAVGDRGQGAGLARCRPPRGGRGRSRRRRSSCPLKSVGQPAEGLDSAVDDRHRVALVLEGGGEAGTDPATTDYDDVHVWCSPVPRGLVPARARRGILSAAVVTAPDRESFPERHRRRRPR